MDKVYTERDVMLGYDDATLLKYCIQQPYIATGNGGQHRNKTYSAIRLIHEPTQTTVTDVHSRSWLDNRHDALRKLRYALAVEWRCPSVALSWPPPGKRHADYFLFVAHLLDLLYCHHGALRDTALACQTTTAQVIKYVSSDLVVLTACNTIRRTCHLPPIRPKI